MANINNADSPGGVSIHDPPTVLSGATIQTYERTGEEEVTNCPDGQKGNGYET